MVVVVFFLTVRYDLGRCLDHWSVEPSPEVSVHSLTERQATLGGTYPFPATSKQRMAFGLCQGGRPLLGVGHSDKSHSAIPMNIIYYPYECATAGIMDRESLSRRLACNVGAV